jgi:hypothetical protein
MDSSVTRQPVAYALGSECGIRALPNRDRKEASQKVGFLTDGPSAAAIPDGYRNSGFDTPVRDHDCG